MQSREAALDIIGAVLDGGRPLDQVLASHEGLAALSPRDRGFARAMVAAALRRLGEIDARIAACMDRPLPAREKRARNILRLGIAQLTYLQTPPHAAVDGAVRLAATRAQRLKGLINAVLRRIVREGPADPGPPTPWINTPEINTPDWLWQSWVAAHGDAARAIAAAHLAEPPRDFSLSQGADPARWAEVLKAEMLPTGSLRAPAGGRVEDLPGYAGDGGGENGGAAWWVQDAAAALPARLLLGALGPRAAGAAVLDLCAAPGGKTAQLCDAGAQVTAIDIAPARVATLEANLARLGLDAEVITADAAGWTPDQTPDQTPGQTPGRAFDAVLLDAPCSATGTIRRHPDIPWLKRPEDVARMAALQSRLLDAAARLVKPGGLLVYAVCSLQPEEGPDQIAPFLARAPNFARLPMTGAELPGLEHAITGDGDAKTLPCHWADRGGIDGFFIARLIRADR